MLKIMLDKRFFPGLAVLTFGVGILATAYCGEKSAKEVQPPAPARLDQSFRLTLKSKTELKQRSPWFGATYIKKTGTQLVSPAGYSEDNGKTWIPLVSTPDFDSKLPSGYRREFFPLFLDEINGRLIRVLNSLDTKDLDPTIEEPAIALKTYYLRYRVSLDGGKTFENDDPVVQKGTGYSIDHSFDGVWRGKNAIFLGDMGSTILRTREGKLLVPSQVCTVDANRELSSPGGGFTYTDVVILIGTWTKQNRLDWSPSQRIVADPKRSTRGMIEPTLAEFEDGRILCVMRGSNGGSKDPAGKIPSHKWASISKDGGRTWTTPVPWTYSDGTSFHSPSSMSQLLRHSNGRYYWIGNISPGNAQGNSPRWPLMIGEVDRKSLLLIRDSLLTVDTLRPEDKDGVELSPHCSLIEDRVTGDLLLPMTRFTGGYKSSRPYLYRIGTR